MNFEIITKDDLKSLKDEILSEMATLLKGKTEKKEWLKSTEVRTMLNCSSGTLQNLRVSGTLPYTKIGGTLYYSHSDVTNILNENKRNIA